MPKWVLSILKLILGVLIDKFSAPIIQWVKDQATKLKKAKEVDKAVKDLDDAKTKDDYADRLNDLP